MISFSLKRIVALAAIGVLPMACAPNVSGVTPAPSGSRLTQSGGAPGGGGGGGGAATCQPLPGTCVLNATIALSSRVGGLSGQIRFERSPTRMAVTGTLHPGTTLPNAYYAILVDSGTPGVTLGYAARGVMNPQTKVVTLETIPGDGLFSQTPNAMPVDSNFVPDRVFGVPGWSFVSDPTPPLPEALALFAAVQSGSSVRIATLGVPGQICPCPPPGPVVPALLQYDLPPSTLR